MAKMRAVLAAGLYPDPATFAGGWPAGRRFATMMPDDDREARYRAWRDALVRALFRR